MLGAARHRGVSHARKHPCRGSGGGGLGVRLWLPKEPRPAARRSGPDDREEEREGTRGDPDREAKAWLGKLAEVGRRRARYQEMAADDLISLDELRAKLAELEETRTLAEQELGNLEHRRQRMVQSEVDKAELTQSFSSVVQERLEALTGERRHRIYKKLRLKVAVGKGGQLEEAQGVFVNRVCTNERTSSMSGPPG